MLAKQKGDTKSQYLGGGKGNFAAAELCFPCWQSHSTRAQMIRYSRTNNKSPTTRQAQLLHISSSCIMRLQHPARLCIQLLQQHTRIHTLGLHLVQALLPPTAISWIVLLQS
jgi:hypothetical protein